jgi:hypothetical protein
VPVGQVELLVNARGVVASPGSPPLSPQAARRCRDGFPPHLDWSVEGVAACGHGRRRLYLALGCCAP